MKKGQCAICKKNRLLTFEHIPPRKAFNDQPISTQNHDHLFENESYLFNKKSRSNKGLGKYSLCEFCNNNTGQWYAKDYSEFAIQAMSQLKSHQGQYGFHSFNFTIKPLNILKQIITMFFSVNNGSILNDDLELVDFVLNKENVVLPKKYKIYIYYSLSNKYRINGNVTTWSDEGEIVNWSEINFKPFGYILAINSSAPNKLMTDITDFSKIEYDASIEVQIDSYYLSISSVYTGQYENV
jgi:hypothetical protein